jgi:hypothetical protein
MYHPFLRLKSLLPLAGLLFDNAGGVCKQLIA